MRTEKLGTKLPRRRITSGSPIPVNRTSAESLKNELDGWLCSRTIWNHDDWEGLLADLRTKGFSDLIDTPKGQDAIGMYLETNKKNPSC